MYARHFYTKNNKWDCDNETGQRAGNADVKERLLIDNDPLHLDDSPESSERGKGKGDKVGKGCRDAIFPAHKIVAHFMGEKNSHD